MRTYLIELANTSGLDEAQFITDIDSVEVEAKVALNIQDAVNLQLPGTPALVVDNFVVSGQQLPSEYDVWEAYVEETIRMSSLPQYTLPDMTIDTSQVYLATVQMESGGQFVMELYPESAPMTVNSFVFLSNEGWFDGVTFHRVIPGFVAQTGDPTGTGRGCPGYAIPNEIDLAFSHAEIGIVAMANSGPDTNGSQWYITLGDAAFLDGSYSIFGRIVEGLDETVMAISPRDPADPAAQQGDVIESITISIKGE